MGQEASQPIRKPVEDITPLVGDVETLRSPSILVSLPGTPEYDGERCCWNRDAMGFPSAIATVQKEEDVIAVINYARKHDANLCIASGRHSTLCMLDNTLVLDLSRLKKISIDKEAMTVTAQAGVKLNELDKACCPHGVVVPAGHNPDTGIAGLTLGGGVGHLCRKYGLTLDHLLSVRVVLASGELVVASEKENEDLFWGIRGGSGNFGVVTEFTFRCHTIPDKVWAGSRIYLLNEVPLLNKVLASRVEILRKTADYNMTMSRDIGAMLILPCGGPVVTYWVHAGPIEEAKKEFETADVPYTPVDDFKACSFHLEVQAMAEANQTPGYYFEKGLLFESYSDECLEVMARISETKPEDGVTALIAAVVVGGAISDVPTEDTAFASRKAHFWTLFLGKWEDHANREKAVKWTREAHAALKPFATGAYAPVIGVDATEEEETLGLYFGVNGKRLRELKRQYDPTNLFKNNRNISPD